MSWKETDVLQLWKNSTIIPIKNEDDIIEKSSVNQRLYGNNSKLWTSLMEMTSENRQMYFDRLICGWPYKWERRAIIYPIYLNNFASCLSTAFIALKINGDIHWCNPNLRYLESLKKCPKIPVFLSIYTTGIANFLLNNFFVFKPVATQEDTPCSSCILMRSILISVLTGVIMPTISTPHISYHIQMWRQSNVPKVNNYVDLFTLSYEFSRSVWRILPFHIVGQVFAAALTTYTMFWGRKQIFDTINVDSEFVKELVSKETEAEKTRWRFRLKKWFSKLSIFDNEFYNRPIKGELEKKKL